MGENARLEDLPINPCKPKQCHKYAQSGEGKEIQLEGSLRMSLKRSIDYIDIDEYVEATPKSLRFRRRILDATERRRTIVVAV